MGVGAGEGDGVGAGAAIMPTREEPLDMWSTCGGMSTMRQPSSTLK